MKALQLGINYGMGVRSLSRGLGRHPLIGSEVIIRHQQRYPTYWAWRDGMVERAMLERAIVSEFDGWPLHLIDIAEPAHALQFPDAERWRRDVAVGGQSIVRRRSGADACWCMTASCSSWTMRSRSQHANEIMRVAGAEVCGGLEIGVDDDQKLIGGARYRDKRPVAKHMWEVVMDVLRKIGALSAEAG